MDKNIKILQEENKSLSLKTIAGNDLGNIRVWKNANRHVFFHQNIIGVEQQKAWFQSYLEEPFNFMFTIEYNGSAIGCMGFRIIDNIADIYNVILGDSQYQGRGIMSLSLRVLCSYILKFHTNKITLKVLKTNKIGQRFYSKNGFIIEREKKDYYLMRLSLNIFKKMEIMFL